MKGFAPLLIIIIALVVLGAGVGGYVFVAKEKRTVTTPEKSGISTETSSSPAAANPTELVGLWKVEKAFVVSPTGAFKEAPVPFPLYSEFKNGFICLNWELGETSKCKEYEKINVKGNIIEVIDSSGKIRAIFQWGIANDTLEFIQIVDGKPQSKTLSVRKNAVEFSLPKPEAPTPSQTAQDPHLLVGSWRMDKILGFNPATEQWEEGTGTGVAYQEFTGKNTCSSYQILSASNPEIYKCLTYSPYSVSGDVISYEAYDVFAKSNTTTYFRWNVVGSTLELAVGISNKPFLKYVYSKIAAPPPPASFVITIDKPTVSLGSFGGYVMISSPVETTDTVQLWVTDSQGTRIKMGDSVINCDEMPVSVCASPSGLTIKPDLANPQCPFASEAVPRQYGGDLQMSPAICFTPWGYRLDSTMGPVFSFQMVFTKAGSYVIHAKLASSGLEAKVPVTVTQ